MHSKVSRDTHPLLTPDLLKIKTSHELYGGTHSQGAETSPSSEARASFSKDDRLRESVNSLSIGELSAAGSSRMEIDENAPPEVPPDILQLSATFPFPWSLDLGIRKRIREALPPREEALRICEEARKNALWQ